MKSVARTMIAGLAAVGLLIQAGGCCGLLTPRGKSTLLGAGLGAVAGEAVKGKHDPRSDSVLIGAGVGAGLGFLLGNSKDKAAAKERTAPTPAEMKPLAGTTWRVDSIVPTPEKPFQSMMSLFGSDGVVTTTVVQADGKKETDRERYRIVASTLIINDRDYIINGRFRIEGDKMFLDVGDASLVLSRMK
jgi:hypothetical protein